MSETFISVTALTPAQRKKLSKAFGVQLIACTPFPHSGVRYALVVPGAYTGGTLVGDIERAVRHCEEI